jgi:superfamily II DNA or RNA helicase
MARYFNKKGTPSTAVYSGAQGEHSSQRDEAINKLKNGELKILFSVDMFNEGLDIPAIDTVLFLRPTQSPTIFLQQLGRGLRKHKNKKYLTILDFIGNYKKANIIPFLLSGNEHNTKTLIKQTPLDFEYPEDCHIDFDFQLIDLFKEQAKNELTAKDKIITEYDYVKSQVDHRPNRVELFLRMDETVINAMKKTSKLNLFKDYLGFLNDNNELNKEEEIFFNTPAHKFLKTLENTSMTKSYKMPIFQAFYNNGDIKMAITDDDVYKTMKKFYNQGSNGVDMLKDKSSKDYKSWGKKEYVTLAKKKPVENSS